MPLNQAKVAPSLIAQTPNTPAIATNLYVLYVIDYQSLLATQARFIYISSPKFI